MISELIDFFTDTSRSKNDFFRDSDAVKLNFSNDYNKKGFIEAFNKFNEYREEIKDLEEEINPILQIEYSIDWIRREKDSLTDISTIKNEIAELIRKSLYSNWTLEQQSFFDLMVKVILDWKIYFISYSRNKKGKSGYFQSPEMVNRDYEKFIRRRLPSIEIEEEGNWLNENLLVKAIVSILDEENFDEFYDCISIQPGDDINIEIENACKSSLVFIQLIHKGIFHRSTKPTQNYPFIEWSHICSMNNELVKSFPTLTLDFLNNRKKFLLCGSAIKDVFPKNRINPTYKDWEKEIRNKLGLLLCPTKGFNDEINELIDSIANLYDELQKKIPN